MFLSSGSELHRRLSRSVLLSLGLAVVAAGFIGFGGPARAATPVDLSFDNGRLSLGIFTNRTILPATEEFPSESLPTPQPHTDVRLTGTEDAGNLNFPASLNGGSQFPYMNLQHPLEPDLKIPFTFRLNEPGLSGTWDPGTGEMSLDGSIDLIVVTGLGTNPLSMVDSGVPSLGLFARCRFNDIPVSFSTAGNAVFTGEPFGGGLGVNGALTTDWATMQVSISENGGECDDLNRIIFGPGGIWLANAVVEPAPLPEPEPVCPGAVDCPVQTFANIGKLRLLPKKRKRRAGKKTRVRVRVTNDGNGLAENVLVRFRSSNKRVKVRNKLRLTIPPGTTVSRKVRVKIKRKARGRARIVARTSGLARRSVVKIRPPRKRGR